MTLEKTEPGRLDPLCALVCGFEKSGTTLINEILRRHPRLDSGHEVGVLLVDSPREFHTKQPYYSFFRETWKLSKAEAEEICDTDDWSTFYRRARTLSPVIVDKSVSIFDKTPVYMLHLSDVLDKAPLPCIVSVRDPRALMNSWANWSGHSADAESWLDEHFERNRDRFLSYARGYRRASRSHAELLRVSQFEELSNSPETEFEKIFEFLGLEFRTEYLSFESEHFVYGNAVSTDYVFAYRDSLSSELCERILDATSEFEEWHYHAG
ncbi:MAG: sulfotransferase family protein [Acidimicrobiales bacterium]